MGTDHPDYDDQRIVPDSQLVVGARNATKGIRTGKSPAAEGRTSRPEKLAHRLFERESQLCASENPTQKV
jgi:hypothetical protein